MTRSKSAPPPPQATPQTARGQACLPCPACGNTNSEVLRTLHGRDATTRHRQCLACSHVYHSIEVVGDNARAQLIERAYDAGLLIPQDLRLPSMLGMPAIVERPESDPLPIARLRDYPRVSNAIFFESFGKPPELSALHAEEAAAAAKRKARMARLREVVRNFTAVPAPAPDATSAPTTTTPEPTPSTSHIIARDGIMVAITPANAWGHDDDPTA